MANFDSGTSGCGKVKVIAATNNFLSKSLASKKFSDKIKNVYFVVLTVTKGAKQNGEFARIDERHRIGADD